MKHANKIIETTLALLLLFILSMSARADIRISDDRGRQVTLVQPAQRIVSLAPHITETVFAAGAGGQLVGAVEYSDYPVQAQSISRVGSYPAPDLERILALQPDLVIAWYSGNPPRLIEKLIQSGITVYYTEPREVIDIATAIRHIGLLTGHATQAEQVAETLTARFEKLRADHSTQQKLKVFYQVWNTPLITINGEHLISKVISVCGGENVFADLSTLTPTVSVEAVLASGAEVIISGGMASAQPQWLDSWKRWPQLAAVKFQQLYFINPDLMHRAGPRIIDGAEHLCEMLRKARVREK